MRLLIIKLELEMSAPNPFYCLMIRGCHKKTTGLEGEVGVRSEVANLTALGCKVQATI